MRSFVLAFFSTMLIVTASPAAGRPAGETVWIPMQASGSGDRDRVRLEATLYLPEGAGPFPVVVFNHGSTGPGVIPVEQTESPWGFAEYLNQKGIALIAPMRRGRGRSDGRYKEGYRCSLKSVRKGVEYADASVAATFDYLDTVAWADRRRVMLAGFSRGGFLSVAHAARHPGRVVGVINFSGGWVGDGCKARTRKDANAVLLGEAGGRSGAPQLFLYGANDHYYSDASVKAAVEAFEAQGGDVEFALIELAPDVDGHRLFFDYWPLWMPYTDAFLDRTGMVSPVAGGG